MILLGQHRYFFSSCAANLDVSLYGTIRFSCNDSDPTPHNPHCDRVGEPGCGYGVEPVLCVSEFHNRIRPRKHTEVAAVFPRTSEAFKFGFCVNLDLRSKVLGAGAFSGPTQTQCQKASRRISRGGNGKHCIQGAGPCFDPHAWCLRRVGCRQRDSRFRTTPSEA